MRPRRSGLLEGAAGIGDELCRAAYWHDDQCNWVGRTTDELARPGLPLTPTVAALGPSLYAGTAGVALFLAELAPRTDSELAHVTALAAIRHSLARAREIPPRLRRAFYSGLVGIAHAAVHVGETLDEPALVLSGTKLARQATVRDHGHLLDVIGGNAGSVAPLLRLSTSRGGAGLEMTAISLAEELAAAAIRTEDTWCWENDRACGPGMGATPLCGFAHGASGMGLALIEAGVHFNRRDLIDGGLAAFTYEDRLYDPELTNWPDLRELEGDTPGAPPPRRPSSMVAWCHGAAGIGLARLRAYELLPEQRPALRLGIERAIEATTRQLDALPAEADASPCHGRAGLAETLIYAAGVLDDSTYVRTARAMWASILKKRAPTPRWRSGVASGEWNPSLMLGLAGVGLALLRAYEPRTPSPSLTAATQARE
jgi:lantibiotic modifying enzyme